MAQPANYPPPFMTQAQQAKRLRMSTPGTISALEMRKHKAPETTRVMGQQVSSFILHGFTPKWSPCLVVMVHDGKQQNWIASWVE